MNADTKMFATETGSVKRRFIGLALFLMLALTIAGVLGRQPWDRIVVAALIFPIGFLAFFWLYGVLAMFDRCYTISPDGVTLTRRNRTLEHIEWQQVAKVSKGNLCVVALDGRKISFNLPPPVQKEALRIIEERLGNHDGAAELCA